LARSVSKERSPSSVAKARPVARSFPGEMTMDLKQLQGAWRAVRIEKEGKIVPDDVAATVRYIFDDDRVILMEGDQKAGEGIIRLDPATDPKSFDFMATEGPQAETTV